MRPLNGHEYTAIRRAHETPECRERERMASMQRAMKIRREVLNALVSALFGLLLLVAMSAPWDRLQ